MDLPQISGNPTFFRFAVAEHQGKYGVIMVDDRNGVSPVGKQEFESSARAEQQLRTALGDLIDGKAKPGTWG